MRLLNDVLLNEHVHKSEHIVYSGWKIRMKLNLRQPVALIFTGWLVFTGLNWLKVFYWTYASQWL